MLSSGFDYSATVGIYYPAERMRAESLKWLFLVGHFGPSLQAIPSIIPFTLPEHSGVSRFIAVISDRDKLADSVSEWPLLMLFHPMRTGSNLTAIEWRICCIAVYFIATPLACD